MAGYSTTPLAGKLGVREGHRVAILGAPAPLVSLLTTGFPAVEEPLAGPLDVVLLFAEWRADLYARVMAVRPLLTPAGAVWICWPKKASRRPTDVSEDLLRELFLPTGLVDNKVCAIDEVWSGLRFVMRKSLR